MLDAYNAKYDAGMPEAAAEVLDALADLQPNMLKLLGDLVRIPSISGTDEENDAQAFLAGVLDGAAFDVDHWRIDLDALGDDPEFPGMEVERSEAWGLVGRRPGTGDGAALMLNGHIDVVPIGDPDAWETPPFAAQVRDGQLHGRGSCDMKAGMVAALWAAEAIRIARVQLRGDLLMASVQGEEDGGLGTFATLRRGWRADACVIPEPTSLATIPANSGALTFRLRVHGSATHAARRTDGVSAIDKFWPIWHALADLEQRRHEVVDPRMTRWALAHPLSIGTVRAGDWASSVPDLLVAEGRMGVALDEPVADARQALEDAVAEVCAADPWLRDHPVSVEWWGGQFASGALSADSDLVDRVARAHRRATGIEQDPDVYGAPYGSDLRLLTGLGGVATVQYGPGDAKLAHGPFESVPLTEVVTTAQTLAVLALGICGVA